jgi:putrescine transport system permease protein
VISSVVLPLSLPGIAAGALLVFIPAVGEFVIPDLLGGPSNLMVGRVLWNEFFSNHDWPFASALAIVMLIAVLLPAALIYRVARREELA